MEGGAVPLGRLATTIAAGLPHMPRMGPCTWPPLLLPGALLLLPLWHNRAGTVRYPEYRGTRCARAAARPVTRVFHLLLIFPACMMELDSRP